MTGAYVSGGGPWWFRGHEGIGRRGPVMLAILAEEHGPDRVVGDDLAEADRTMAALRHAFDSAPNTYLSDT